MDVYTLYVISVSRGAYVADDIAASIRWTSEKPCFAIFVDLNDGIQVLGDNGFVLMKTGLPADAEPGFHRAAAIKWAIDQGFSFKQVISMSEDCLIIGRTLDSWALDQIAKNVGLVGVQDRLTYEDSYSSCLEMMSSWKMPHARWEVAPQTVATEFTVLSGALAAALFQCNLLIPPGCEKWPLPYGPFISWAAQMLGHFQVSWGHQDKQMPPLYCGHPGRNAFQPAPHILATRFLLYSSVRHAMNYSEEDLREIYKRLRGEPARVVQPLRPIVSGEGLQQQ